MGSIEEGIETSLEVPCETSKFKLSVVAMYSGTKKDNKKAARLA